MRAPLRCSACRGLNVTMVETRPDNDGVGTRDPRLATVWRVRLCEDCGHVSGTAEVRMDIRLVRAALSRLAADRRTFA